MRALFDVLKGEPDGLAAKDAIQATRTKITLLPEEEGVFAGSGVEKFPRLLRFSTINVVKAGWMVKNDGTWTVTDAGMKAYNDYSDPEAFYKQARSSTSRGRRPQLPKSMTRTRPRMT